MVRSSVKIDYPGLLEEKLPSGQTRYRVRPKGDFKTRITLSCGKNDEDFLRQYQLARAGDKPEPMKKASEVAMPKSIGWLVNSYLEYLEERIKSGNFSAKTLKKKRNLLLKLLDDPERKMLIPREKLIERQDKMVGTPAQADAFIEAIGVMYDWAIERKYVPSNPARGVPKIYEKGDGATPWNAADVEAFFARHRKGSVAHVSMSVLLWTGCRIEDTIMLGRKFECLIDGVEAVRWTPQKKHSTEVIVPLLPPLKEATRAPKVQGSVYVLGRGGKPFSSGDSASAMFKRWCHQAGIGHLSAHGVRKGLAELLAGMGCSQYEIMAILGHSEAKTSEVYTKRVQRWHLALGAMSRVNALGSWSK